MLSLQAGVRIVPDPVYPLTFHEAVAICKPCWHLNDILCPERPSE